MPVFTHAPVRSTTGGRVVPVCCLIHVDDAKIFTQRCAPDRIITEFIHVTHRKGIVNLRVALYCYRHLYRCDTPAPLRGTRLCYAKILDIETCARYSPATFCPNNRLAANHNSNIAYWYLECGIYFDLFYFDFTRMLGLAASTKQVYSAPISRPSDTISLR